MSPRFENSPANVVATMEVFPKDDYLFGIGEPKPFFRQNAKGQDSYGIRLSLTVKEGAYEKKRTVVSLYEHSEGAQMMGKQFKMAALGYGKGRSEEQRFDAEWGTKDWSFDTDSGAVGDGWRELTGKLIIGSLDVGINDNSGDEQQQFKGWRVAGK